MTLTGAIEIDGTMYEVEISDAVVKLTNAETGYHTYERYQDDLDWKDSVNGHLLSAFAALKVSLKDAVRRG